MELQTAAAIGKGMVAGLVGTAAMTVSERVEMAVTGREASDVPGQVGAKLLGLQPATDAEMDRLSTQVHWIHGILGGALRGVLDRAGATGPAASVAHFAALWGGDAGLYAALGIAPAPWDWDQDELAADVLHKGVYAAVTGVVYDALASGTSR